MKTKIISALGIVIFAISISLLLSFNVVGNKKPCEVTCNFLPTTSNFGTVIFGNCNSSVSSSSVLAGTSYYPILTGTGCIDVNISVSLPSTHPGGVLRFYKNGALIYEYDVPVNGIGITRDFRANCEDGFEVRW